MHAHILPDLGRDARPTPDLSRTVVQTVQTARHDLYGAVHKALRAFLSETLVRVGRIDVDDPFDLDEALDQLRQTLDFLTAHLRHEDDFVHPAIEARRLAGTERVSHEHADHVAAIARLHGDVARLVSAACAERATLARRLYLDLVRLVAETLEHLHYEETMLGPLLWELYTDVELAAIHGRLRANMSPADMLLALRWAIPAATPSERASLVSEMKAAMPPEALLSVLVMVRPHLDPTGWIKLAHAAGVTVHLGDSRG